MTGRIDAFSRRHPAVTFVFFALAICFGVTIQHPVYLLAGMVAAGIYYLLLKGVAGLRFLLGMLPFLLLIALVNPIINDRGQLILFHIFGRPYTFEALMYGVAVAGMLAVMLLWFGCYNVVMTSDKFTALFGGLIPSLSLLLVMVLRMVPNLLRKAGQISGARRSIGKGAGQTVRGKLANGMSVLSALTSWALEGGIITGDSMRSRGYGSGKRSSFMVYRMTRQDWAMLTVMLALAVVAAVSAALGSAQAEFMPTYVVSPITGHSLPGFLCYCLLLLLPTLSHGKEVLQWYIIKSKI